MHLSVALERWWWTLTAGMEQDEDGAIRLSVASSELLIDCLRMSMVQAMRLEREAGHARDRIDLAAMDDPKIVPLDLWKDFNPKRNIR